MSSNPSPGALRLRAGSVIVFEGIDKAGKSTQLERMKRAIDPVSTTFAHMPSGFSDFTAGVYALLEDKRTAPTAPLAQQLTHLACHSESMTTLVDKATHGALVLDRWWWSTLAYGWYFKGEDTLGIDERTFRALIETVWAPIHADVVFLFLHAYAADSNNADAITRGYLTIAEHSPVAVVVVPPMTEDETHTFVMAKLQRYGLSDV